VGVLFMAESRAIIFFDGQNLYHGVKDAWGIKDASGKLNKQEYFYPSFDVEQLATSIVSTTAGRIITQIRFYTGVPRPNLGTNQKLWHTFWSNKLRYLSSKGIIPYKGQINSAGHEKGVDVSIAIDLIRFTYQQSYEVAVIVSQDLALRIRIAKYQAVFLLTSRSLAS
jgi:uncharacterized LabA/DUF88 family protein